MVLQRKGSVGKLVKYLCSCLLAKLTCDCAWVLWGLPRRRTLKGCKREGWGLSEEKKSCKDLVSQLTTGPTYIVGGNIICAHSFSSVWRDLYLQNDCAHARASSVFSSKDNRTVILTRQDFLPDRTADGDLLFTFRESFSSYLKFGWRHEDSSRFCR